MGRAGVAELADAPDSKARPSTLRYSSKCSIEKGFFRLFGGSLSCRFAALTNPTSDRSSDSLGRGFGTHRSSPSAYLRAALAPLSPPRVARQAGRQTNCSSAPSNDGSALPHRKVTSDPLPRTIVCARLSLLWASPKRRSCRFWGSASLRSSWPWCPPCREFRTPVGPLPGEYRQRQRDPSP